MKIRRTSQLVSCAAALALTLTPALAPRAGGAAPHGSSKPAKARGRGAAKLSDDLREKLGKKEAVRVIVQSAGGASEELREELSKKGGSAVRKFESVEAFAAEVRGEELETLAGREDVAYVSPDRPTSPAGHVGTTTGADLARAYGTASTGAITGRGVAIAFLDSGVAANHHAFLSETSARGRERSRVVAQANFVSNEKYLPHERYADQYGHGTHVAAVAAGGSHLADGAYTGVAPEADIVSLKVLRSDGTGLTSDALAALDWVIRNKNTYNVRVMNLSFGAAAVESYTRDPLCRAVERAWAAGIVVVAAAGNAGKDADGRKVYGAIHSPGVSPYAATVGAANTFGTDWRGDDGVASYSSRGPTRGSWVDAGGVRHYDNLIKPDLVAPGNKVAAASSPRNKIVRENPELAVKTGTHLKGQHDVLQLSGTSVAAPAVAGAAALILQRNPSLTPNLVKAVLEYTAQPLAGFNQLEQGAGLLNVEGAVRLAGLIRTDLGTNTAVGTPLLAGEAPAPRSSVAGTEFGWSGGLVQRWNVVSGPALMEKWQGFYAAAGKSLADGVTLSEGRLRPDGVTLSEGVLMSDGVLMSEGFVITKGALVLNGVILSDGVILADQMLIADGVVLSDGILVSSRLGGLSALLAGDPGTAMLPVGDAAQW